MEGVHMRSKVPTLTLAVAVAGLIFAGMAAGGNPTKGTIPNGPAGRSPIAHLYLYEKNPETWEIVEGGAWGKMKYNQYGLTFDFVFNGHGLEAGYEYTLIYYPDPWPGNGLICLGEGTADIGGNVHIQGSVDTGDMPSMYDDNYGSGAKIWLILSDDVNCITTGMIGWNPTEYIFEYDLISFDDTDF
jgi:hypothetical protein